MLGRVTHMTTLGVVTCVMNVGDQTSKSFVTGSCPFCDCSSKFVYRPQECQVYQFVPRTSIPRQSVSIPLTVLQQIRALPARMGDHPGKGLGLCTVAPLSCSPIHSVAQRIFEHVLPCRGTAHPSLREVCLTLVIFSIAAAEIRDSNISLYFFPTLSFRLHARWAHPKFSGSRNKVGWSRSTFFHQFLPRGSYVLLSSSHSDVIHVYRTILVFGEQRDIPISVLFSIQVPNRTSSTCLSHKRPASGCPYRFR